MTTGPNGPLLICYDGSEDARHAIERAGELLRNRPALVLTVWQPVAGLGSFAWSGATTSMVNFVELDRAAAEDAGRVAAEGVRVANEAGLEAEPVATEATGPVWEAILEIADQQDAAAVVHGLSRTDGRPLDPAWKCLQGCRPSRRPADVGSPSAQRRRR